MYTLLYCSIAILYMQLWGAKAPKTTQWRIVTNINININITHILDIILLSLQKPRTSLLSTNVSQYIIPQSTTALYIIRIPSLHSSYKKQKYTSNCSNLLVPELLSEKECEFWELWEWHYLQIQELQNLLCHRTAPSKCSGSATIVWVDKKEFCSTTCK